MSEASEKMLHSVWSMGNLNAISLVACDFLCSLKWANCLQFSGCYRILKNCLNTVWVCPRIFLVIPTLFRSGNRKPVLVMMAELTENRRQSISSKRWMLDVIHAGSHPCLNPDVYL